MESWIYNGSTTAAVPTITSELNSSAPELRILNLYIIPTIYSIITLIGIFGNCLVIYVIIAEKKYRTVMNIMLLNLAISDLSFVTVCPPFTAYRTVRYELGMMLEGALASVLCKMMQYLLNVTVYVTIYTLTLISIIRYMAIMHDTRTERFRSHRAVVGYIIVIWIINIVAQTPVLFHFGLVEGVCGLETAKAGRAVFGSFAVLAYLLPLSIIIIFSVSVRQQLQRKSSFTLADCRKSHVTKVKASRLLIAIVAMFATLWLPIHLLLNLGYWGLLKGDSEKVIPLFLAIAQCMAYGNSCVNPIVYNFVSREFRSSFHRVIFCKQQPRTRVFERNTEIRQFLKNHHTAESTCQCRLPPQ